MAILALFLALFLGGCTGRKYPPPDLKPTVILVSFDGFRWDYLDKAPTPNLHALAATGVRASSLRSIFPSMTFPNHYTIVTGLYAEHHGIVNNDMYDPATGRRFAIHDEKAVESSFWWGGEPIWVTAEKQGQRTASMYWIGSSAEIEGKRPSFWYRYKKTALRSARVQAVMDWLDLPGDRRPTFITLYFADADTAGHEYGPDSDEVKKAIRDLDETTGELVSELKRRRIDDKVNLIFVSDHGMTRIPPGQVIPLEKYLPAGKAVAVGSGALVGLFPKSNVTPAELVKAFEGVPHLHAYLKEALPARFHYRDNPRIAPVQLLPDEGWMITKDGKKPPAGAHGYDPALADMHGFFLAHGPAFRSGLTVGEVRNINIYDLIARILNLKPAPNDGNFEEVKGLLNGG